MFTEGVLKEPAAPPSFSEIGDPDTGFTGCIDVTVPESALAKDIHGRRSAMGTASCGFCGLREPEELQLAGDAVVPPPARPLPAARIPGLLEALRDGQRLFRQTGGTHGAMAFNSDTTPLCLHEDIGRHNAVDKVIGELVLTGKLTTAVGLVVSGRISYEIVYKACRAKLPYLLGVSAPSSLAVEMAGRFGICLLAFCREDRATVYSRPDRVQRASDEA
jgi:FdhD protein